VPKFFGHGNAFADWGVLGNDLYGDCVWAGGAHETELLNWLAAGGIFGASSPVSFTTDNVLADYGSTGFVKTDPTTDQGTVVGDALEYRRKTGLIDASGRRHKIAAYVKLDVGNLDMLLEALYLFEAVGIGIQFPTSAMDQFNAGQPWTPVPNAQIDGGHYIPLVGRPAPGVLDCVTWGKTQQMTDAFFQTYCDEAYGILSLEGLRARTQTNYEGFAWSQLASDAKVIGTLSNDPGVGPGPVPTPPVTPPAPAPLPAPGPVQPTNLPPCVKTKLAARKVRRKYRALKNR
jgi:hypothetical protein